MGSTQLLTDEGGAVAASYRYDAWGELLDSTGDVGNPYLFTGEQYDAGLDQYYLRARYYDQGVGRFTQMDTWMGVDFLPVTLNKCIYANADPVLYTDPSGNIPGFGGGGFIQITSYTAFHGYKRSSSARRAQKAYNGMVRTLCRQGKHIGNYFKRNRKDFEGHHSHPKYLGGEPSQALVRVASLLHVRLHSLVRYIHRLNGLKIDSSADFEGLTKYQKGKALVLLLKTTEAFDMACEGVRGYKPIAPQLRKLLGR